MTKSNHVGNRPYLTTLAVNRTSTISELPGRYLAQKDVWVIDGPRGPIPIVAASYEDYSIAPVTKIERDELRSAGILELATKTMQQLERDDVTPRNAMLLPELVTKTEEIRERDDPSPRLLLELATKTANLPERDDR
jgi:hypothetical protein